MRTYLILSVTFFASHSAFSQTVNTARKIQPVTTEEPLQVQPMDTSGVLISSKREIKQEEIPVEIISTETKTENGQTPVIMSTARKPE